MSRGLRKSDQSPPVEGWLRGRGLSVKAVSLHQDMATEILRDKVLQKAGAKIERLERINEQNRKQIRMLESEIFRLKQKLNSAVGFNISAVFDK